MGVALPRAQLGQPNGASADVAEPVRQALMSYLKGPVIEVIALEARIPVQIAAEAKEKGCAFVLYTDVAQTAKGGGLKMLKKLAPMAGMLPMLGGGGMGDVGAQMAASAVTQTVAAVANGRCPGRRHGECDGGDQRRAEVQRQGGRFTHAAVQAGARGRGAALQGSHDRRAKAKANGEDVLSPMIESVAVAVVGGVAGN